MLSTSYRLQMETEREEYGDDSEMIAPERIILNLDLDATWLVTSSIGLCAGKLHIMVTATLRRHHTAKICIK